MGVVTAADGSVLVAERDAARHAGGGLEFPGGKVEPEEAAEQALARELAEELGLQVATSTPLMRLQHDYPDRRVELCVFRVTAWQGQPTGCEGQALHWLPARELVAAQFPAANRPIVACLQWPARLAVTAPTLVDNAGELGQRVVAALQTGNAVQLRHPDADPGTWQRHVEAVRDAVAGSGGALAPGQVQLNTHIDDPLVRAGGFGLHLSAARAAGCTGRPEGVGRFSCSAHSREELRVAERIGVDYAVVGQVRPSTSHPGRPGLGWAGLAELLAATPLPVYAIGGLGIDDVAAARDHGAVGVAGIRAFW